LVTVDIGLVDFTLTCVLSTAPTTGRAGPAIRFLDLNNWWAVAVDGSGAPGAGLLLLTKTSGLVLTADSAAYTPTGGDVLKVVCNSIVGAIDVYINNILKIHYVTAFIDPGATSIGLYRPTFSDNDIAFDNLTVTGL
jgi:hypothetical protein